MSPRSVSPPTCFQDAHEVEAESEHDLRTRLLDLVDKMEALAAESECDFGVVNIPFGNSYELFRDGRWMLATDARYEQVSPMDIADDIGIEKFIEILERWLEDEP